MRLPVTGSSCRALGIAVAIAGTAFGGEPGRRPAATSTRVSRPEPPPPKDLVVIAGGDVSFGREAGRAVLRDPSYRPFRKLEPLWGDADVRFLNLESQLSDRGGETQSPYDRLIFAGPPDSAEVLALSGVHVVSTANNHAWDYGKPALLETLSYLDQTGVAHAGTGATLAEAEAPALLEIGGKRVAFFAVTQIWNQGEFKQHPGREHVAWADAKSVAERVARAKPTHDLVFVSYHGGAEYVNAPWTALSFADQVMRAGADALFGHHPHVIQGIGWFDERPAFYSLGNLLFGSRKGYPWTRYGMLARLVFSPDGTRRTSVCPYRIEVGSHEPDVLDGPYGATERARFLRHLDRVNAHVGKTALGTPDEFACVEVSNAGPSKGGRRSPRTAPIAGSSSPTPSLGSVAESPSQSLPRKAGP